MRLGVALLIVGVWLYLAHDHAKGHERFRQIQAMHVVGYASLLYLDANARPPRSVQALFDANVLNVTEDGYVKTLGYDVGVPMDLVRSVRISFPDHPDEFELVAGVVQSRRTGEQPVCVDYGEGGRSDIVDWAYLWFRVAQGGPTGVDWLDRLIHERRAAASQPASAPSGG